MKKAFSPYILQKKFRLNSLDQLQPQKGALLKIMDSGAWGVADLSPKPELGDDSIEFEINNGGPLYLRALELAQEDLEARRAGKSLLQNKFIRNNFLINDYKTADLNQALYANNILKIKGDRDIKHLSQVLNSMTADARIRLDFNSILSPDEYRDFLNLLTLETKNKIEYVEDPTVFNLKWKSWNSIIPLAFDFQNVKYDIEFAKFQIIKPGRQKVPYDIKNFTLTSAMDHPVGVAHGLRIAQQLAENDSGFLTLDLFEDIGFNKYFVQNKNYLNFSELALQDIGIGMTEALNNLQWVEL